MERRNRIVEVGAPLPLAFVVACFACFPLFSQSIDTTLQTGPKLKTEGRSRVRVIPGPQYEAGWLHRLFFGDSWRDLWTTPIDVPVLDLDTFAGGLRPLKRGGGYQTKSLRFQAPGNRQFKFRSLDKDPAKVLPEDLRETFVADIVQDFIATSNPVSALVAAPIINAAGVLNAEPILVVLPDDDRLGAYRDEFGGLLGTLEENPDDEGEEAFAGSDKIALTPKLFGRLKKDNDEVVDARDYLTARLVDILLGDWDRHIDQWKWARFDREGRKIWRPIPRDRDQAFCRYDGWIPNLVEVYIPQIEGVDRSYPAIKYLTYSGRHTDWRFLSGLDRATWDSVTSGLIARITDSVIDHAVGRLPKAMEEKAGDDLRRLLRARRDRLHEASDEYYRERFAVVDIRASDKAEYARVERLDNDRVAVAIYDLDSERRPKKTPLFQRTFIRDETDEIRMIMEGGGDSIDVTGEVEASILVRVVTGDDRDIVIDRSHVSGSLFSFLPIPDAETATLVYTDGQAPRVEEGASTSILTRRPKTPRNEAELYEPATPDRGHEWLYFPWVSYTPDEGAFLGGHALLTEYGFRAEPYRDRLSFRAGYATGAARFKGEFRGDFRSVIDGARLDILARGSGLDVINFFGIGNETALPDSLDDEFFEVRQSMGLLRVDVGFDLAGDLVAYVGAEGRYTTTDTNDAQTFIVTSRPYGIDEKVGANGFIGLRLDTRDNRVAPRRGVFAEIEGAFHPKVSTLRASYGAARADLRAYIPIPLSRSVVALRAEAKMIEGDYPYYDAAFIGGSTQIRGKRSQRYAGDGSIVLGAEARSPLAKIRLLIPGTIGLIGFSESGRVWVEGENSDRWHPGYGGGIFFTVVDPTNTFSLVYGVADEKPGFYASAGFAF